MKPPRVTFLLPVFNAAATLPGTLESIASQTLADYELLIIDDGSTDASADILAGFRDSRARIFRNDRNLELAATLNRGLSLATSDYIARIDADDICMPERAARQAAFLDANPAIAAVGSYVESFSAGSVATVIKYPTAPAAVAAGLIFRNTLAHPAVMLNRKLLSFHRFTYDPSIRRSQDYALWGACVRAGLPLANIPEVLLRYRVHANQATARESAASVATAAAVRASLVQALGVAPSAEERRVHEHLSLDTLPHTPADLHAAGAWLRKLLTANNAGKFFDTDAFARVLTGRFVSVARLARSIGLDLRPHASPFAPHIQPGAIES